MRAVHAHSDHEIVYRILDALSESVLTLLRALEAEVTRLENEAPSSTPRQEDRREIVIMRGRLFRLLQVIVPQRDMLDTGAEAIERVLGIGPGQAHHPFADIRDDLVLAVNLIAYCRELLAEALNVHLQATSNRLNTIATRLTVLAEHLRPADAHHRLLRPELRVDGRPHLVVHGLPGARRRRRRHPRERHLAGGCDGRVT